MKIYSLSVSGEIIPYEFTRKKVKNINIRIRSNGTIAVSAPMNVSFSQVEFFIQEKKQWIYINRKEILEKSKIVCEEYTEEECLKHFTVISEKFFPIFKKILGSKRPFLKVRSMKTRWGVCYPAKKIIVINTKLMNMPIEAQEYVILHEYVHFIYPNHQKEFHDLMKKLMPDYKKRRALLK